MRIKSMVEAVRLSLSSGEEGSLPGMTGHSPSVSAS